MPDVTLLGLPPSSYVRTARMTCSNKGVEYRLQPVDFRSDAYRQEHAFQRMPVLHHGDVRLYETLAIATYLDDAFDGPPLQPDAPVDRARMLQWISVTNDYLYKTIVGCCVSERFVKPMRGLEPDEELIAQALPMIDIQLDVLDDALNDTGHFVGNALSLADLFVAPIMVYFAATPEGISRLPKKPGIQAWLEKMKATPHWDEINAIGH